MSILNKIDLALEYIKAGKPRKAEEIYLQILDTDEKNNVILSFLGLLYMNWGKFKKAERVLEKAYAINKSQTTIETLALVKEELKKDKEAGKYFSEIIDTSKNYNVINKYIRLLLKHKKHSQAVDISEKLVKLFPLKKEAQSILIESYIHNGQLKEAYMLSNKLLNNYPKYSDSWLWHGILTEMLFRDDIKAEKCFKNVLKYGDKNKGYYNLSVSAHKRGDLKKSLYYTKKYAKFEAIPISSMFSKANIYMKLRDFKKGIKCYTNSVIAGSLSDPTDSISKLKKLWNGKCYKDETLFIYGDQGIGDIIMSLYDFTTGLEREGSKSLYGRYMVDFIFG